MACVDNLYIFKKHYLRNKSKIYFSNLILLNEKKIIKE